MIILGIDPGLQFTGYGVIEKVNNNGTLKDYGLLRLGTSKKPLPERIGLFKSMIQAVIIHNNITHIALETPFLGKNAQNFLKLGYLRGILYLLAHEHGLELIEFSPRQIKQAVTGWGGAPKDQVARMIFQFFPILREKELKNDVTDALAIMICGLWSTQSKIRGLT
jgi:crossover junction endodeoxyribonuclease RuvC